MKPFAQGTINLFYHSGNAFQCHTDLDGLLDLAKRAHLFICRCSKRDRTYFYDPVNEASLRAAWRDLCALDRDTKENLSKLDLIWTASHLTSVVGPEPDDLSALAAIVSPCWGYTDRSFRRIWFYFNIGLCWGDKPLSPAARKLLKTIEGR